MIARLEFQRKYYPMPVVALNPGAIRGLRLIDGTGRGGRLPTTAMNTSNQSKLPGLAIEPPRVTFSAFESGLNALPLIEGWARRALTIDALATPEKKHARGAFVHALRTLRLIDEKRQPTGRLQALVQSVDRREHYGEILEVCFPRVVELLDAETCTIALLDEQLLDMGARPSLINESRAFVRHLITAAGRDAPWLKTKSPLRRASMPAGATEPRPGGSRGDIVLARHYVALLLRFAESAESAGDPDRAEHYMRLAGPAINKLNSWDLS